MKKILITGSLGYLGSILTPYLVSKGYDVSGIDTGFFKDSILYQPKDADVKILDMRKFHPDSLIGVDCVIHLAGISNDPMLKLDPKKIYDPTAEYAFALAKYCKERGIKFIFASSCSVYGVGVDGILDESSKTTPQTPYSANKLQIEKYLQSITDNEFTPIIFRFATVYGSSPRLRFDLVINMLVGMAFTTKKIILNSDGKAWRPNLHIQDLCNAIEFSIRTNLSSTDPIILNVGRNEDNYQILQIAEFIKDVVEGCKIEFLNRKTLSDNETELINDRKIKGGTDTRTYKVSFDKIQKVLPGFACSWDVKSGIRDLINLFTKINLTKEQFMSRKYYRLQTMEDLLLSKRIDENLFWR